MWTAYALFFKEKNRLNHFNHSFFDKGALPPMTCNTKLPEAVIMRKP